MKRSALVLVNLAFVTFVTITASAQTVTEILKKTFAYHDPGNKWDNYTGKVHILTVFANGNFSGGEILEVRTGDDYYRSTQLLTGDIRVVDKGVPYMEVNGKLNPAGDKSENLQTMKLWHTFHFGLIMEINRLGQLISENVEKVMFNGTDCYAVRFKYDPAKVTNLSLKDADWTFYIDPVNYSLRGFRETVVMKRYCCFDGIMDINGIKLPLCRTYFSNTDNSFIFVDLFAVPK